MTAAIKEKKGRPPKRTATHVEKVCVGSREGWRLTYNGRHKTVVTSPSSAIAIKDAAKLYNSVLKRLADK